MRGCGMLAHDRKPNVEPPLRSDLEEAAALRRRAEDLCWEARDLIDEAQVSIETARDLLDRSEQLLRDLNAAISASRRRLKDDKNENKVPTTCEHPYSRRALGPVRHPPTQSCQKPLKRSAASSVYITVC